MGADHAVWFWVTSVVTGLNNAQLTDEETATHLLKAYYVFPKGMAAGKTGLMLSWVDTSWQVAAEEIL